MVSKETIQETEEKDKNMSNGDGLVSSFSNYDRLLVELNNRMYYDKETYQKFLVENGLIPEDMFEKETNYVQLLETVYSILQTLLSNIDMYRKIETEFVTSGQAATELQNRLKSLRTEINHIKAEMHFNDSDFTYMYFTC